MEQYSHIPFTLVTIFTYAILYMYVYIYFLNRICIYVCTYICLQTVIYYTAMLYKRLLRSANIYRLFLP